MKHIKTFESVNDDKPQVGDWVICKESFDEGTLCDFISNNIGKFIRYRRSDDHVAPSYTHIIQYENIPTELLYGFKNAENQNNCRGMKIYEILKWSKDKEDLELQIKTQKYNL